ncbi:putative nucleoid associated protein NdpA [Advenella mimigardefordensis DPN7]|uniref:Putative nucleoid associated protein NdpA n=1 Tax=Advenella mimigardefordensis (strain DSM 17166 / LMG 22922 / DPN7) TaxID=1247726 RepID=W0PIW2_ADVMD|nr:putative nucleoid associated protein NdpA [Advenella mimigardefordensis DPN7]
MGFFTDEEVGSLRITNMILHVVGGDEFVPEPARVVEHEAFFIARIRDTDVSAVYSFEETSNTKAQIEAIATGAVSFEAGAQALSNEFSRLHVGSSRDGALFIFELSTHDPQTRIYSFVKYDYREAIEQAAADEGGLLRRIVTAFIADKKAIQKSTIIRVNEGVAELPISTQDRMKVAPEIGDYFATFLNVSRTLSDEMLNKKTVDVLRTTLTFCKELLPEQDVARAFRHAQGILRDRQEINEAAITDAILAASGNPEDEEVRGKIQLTTRRRMRAAKLDGLQFRPDRHVLRRPPLRKIRTTEGVTLTYPDEAEGLTVRRERLPAGAERFIIQTARVTEDNIVRSPAR